ncbi:uncharacterized protein JN550_001061 [Neoarthrinium moseri]|uniref:uncharacterized protein n=1 Tax=Neoarthrinium moseri TaxID=1658444 RepID=UPI001FDBAD27|nr:uncharacterized protein JN550_001061 [Neoarthrinium moseri]KAI1876989.1 hypothetical protein JN550_001061 [Neoarthrinium moseri]
MSPPLPVPSKAAIRALRGLALGTSCALGLIVEDRRRRISTLRTAISNKKKLRTSRKYHGSAGAAEATKYPLDDLHILSGEELHWHYQPDLPLRTQDSAATPCRLHGEDSTKRLRLEGRADTPSKSTESPIAMEDKGHRKEASRPAPGRQARTEIPPLHRAFATLPNVKDTGGWARSPATPRKPLPSLRIEEISRLPAVEIQERLETKELLPTTYITAFVEASHMKKTFRNGIDNGWLNVSEALCLHCQATGRWQEAQDILAAIVQAGPINEERFYAHNPVPVVESILSSLDGVGKDEACGKLQKALQLFLTKFSEKPTTHADEVTSLGKAIISRLLEFHRPGLVHQVYWRVLGQQSQPEHFVAWFIKALFDHHDHKSVVNYFKLNFSKLSPALSSFRAVVQMVLESVDAMQGAQAQQVTRALASMCSATGLTPEAVWLTKLLQAHWSRYKDLAKSQEFFDELSSLGLLDRTSNPEQIYQIMVKLSVLASDYPTAKHYYQKTVILAPRMQKDIRLNGSMALMQAKNGAWDEVLTEFSKMKAYRKTQPDAYGQTFAAVFKVYMETHPISDVEDFIKLYMEEMDVCLHRYLVTMVANKYSEIHDHKGLLAWLHFCKSEGFALDPAFANAVLRNCRLKWHVPYPVLRKLSLEMQKLDSACADDTTTRIMHNAALESGNYSGRNVRQRLRSLPTSPSKLPYSFRSANERDVLHAMTEELVRGHAAKVIILYKRALRYGMSWSPDCFRVAIKASLQQHGENSVATTIKLISDTHERGHDVTAAVAVFLKAQIDHIRGPFEEVVHNLRKLITQFEALGMLIDASVLTHFAIASAKFGHFHKAINLCKLAMEKRGTSNPCSSRQSLRALLMAYWQTLDVEGIRWIIESLPSSPLAADRTAFRLLKETRRHMKKWQQSERVVQITELLQQGIDVAKRRRAERMEEASEIYSETLRIMGDAVANLEKEQRNQAGLTRNDSHIEQQPEEIHSLDREHRVPLEACG